MDLDRALLEIGGTPVTLLDVLTAAAVFALLLLIAAVILSWRAQANRQAGLQAHGGTGIPHRRTLRRAEEPLEQSQGSQMQLVSTLDEGWTRFTWRNAPGSR